MAVLALACPRCGRPHDEQTRVCGLCGELLRRAPAAGAQERPARTSADPGALVAPAPELPTAARPARPWLEPLSYLALGLLTAPVFAWTPFLGYMGWFLAALVHEMGHAALAWACGMPSIPAISLAGHAAAVHGEPSVLLALAVTALLAALAWTRLAGRARVRVLVGVLLAHPALAFTEARELAHLLAGHGAELLFATLCLWKTLDGGFTDSRAERALYGTVGWYLLGTNLALCFGLLHSTSARSAYRSNGSFGLTNDYLRAAELLGWPLSAVALGMLLAGLLVLPAALGLWKR